MGNIDELERACGELDIRSEALSREESVKIITEVLNKYKVGKTSGHLAICHDSISIPIEDYEFTYSSNLDDEAIYVFFDQEGYSKKQVIEISSGQRLGEIMENSFGMEYFVTNRDFTYLLAVNWYVIEGAGSAKRWIKGLIEK